MGIKQGSEMKHLEKLEQEPSLKVIVPTVPSKIRRRVGQIM